MFCIRLSLSLESRDLLMMSEKLFYVVPGEEAVCVCVRARACVCVCALYSAAGTVDV